VTITPKRASRSSFGELRQLFPGITDTARARECAGQ
jgi:hypothetical protein